METPFQRLYILTHRFSVGVSSEKKRVFKLLVLFTAFRSASGPRSPAAAGGSGWSAGRSVEKNNEIFKLLLLGNSMRA